MTKPSCLKQYSWTCSNLASDNLESATQIMNHKIFEEIVLLTQHQHYKVRKEALMCICIVLFTANPVKIWDRLVKEPHILAYVF